MRYAQEKGGQKLHLVFEGDGQVSQPICGKKVNGYKMTINVSLANGCKNCYRIYEANKGEKTRRKFFESLAKGR